MGDASLVRCGIKWITAGKQARLGVFWGGRAGCGGFRRNAAGGQRAAYVVAGPAGRRQQGRVACRGGFVVPDQFLSGSPGDRDDFRG